MSRTISHDDALRVSSRVGALVASLYGRPDLVIGIENGGTAVAAAFSQGANVPCCTLIRHQRWTTTGWRRKTRKIIQHATPIALRRLFRRYFFEFIVAVSKRSEPRVVPTNHAVQEKLLAVLDRQEHEFIVVVDDAIDSGGTASRVLADLAQIAPRARVMLFTLTSTAGERVTDEQINAFAEILEYEEGDISALASEHRQAVESLRTIQQDSRGSSEQRPLRTLYLDLDGTLVIDSFRCARSTLIRYLVKAPLVARRRLSARLFLVSQSSAPPGKNKPWSYPASN